MNSHNKQQRPKHRPAMVNRVVDFLSPSEGKTILDMTVGVGGHAGHLLEHGAYVIGIDRDRQSLRIADQNLSEFRGSYDLIHGRMAQIKDIFYRHNFEPVDGCLIDAGISTDQLKDESRGFSAESDESLDMRMDTSDGNAPTGYEVVNEYSRQQLLDVFSIISRRGEVRRIVRRIVRARQREPIETTAQLAEIIEDEIARGRPGESAHAAPYLMAIRATVNEELDELRAGIEAACDLLAPTGILVTLTWHSAEHRVSRQTLRRLANPRQCLPSLSFIPEESPKLKVLTPDMLSASEQEMQENPATRSVRMNVAEKLPVKQ